MIPYDNAPRGDLAARWPEWAAGRDRRAQAARKRAIYEENHRGLVLQLVAERIGEPEVTGYVQRFVSRSPNLCKAVVDAVAVGYRRNARRELRGASPSVARAFTDIIAESGIERKAAGLNARSWVCGPMSVSPHLDSRNRLCLDTMAPDQIELRFATMNGNEPDAALWLSGNTWIELDADAWRYYNADGDLVHAAPHTVGVAPLVPFVSVDNTSDFWTRNAHMGLIDATLDVAYKMAYGLYVRQVSANKLTAVFSQTKNISAGQSLGHPALPVVFNASPQEADVKVLDRIVPAMDHLSEIAAIITTAISVYGIPPGTVQMVASNSDWGNLALNVEGPRLGVLRDKQVPWLRHSERELWPIVCDLIRGSAHKHAGVLPPGDECRDMLRVSFPDLAEPKDEQARLDVLEKGLPHGLGSAVDYLLASRPELSPDEAAEILQSNLDAYATRIEQLTSRNIAADPARGVQSVAQLQGREGGIASGVSRNEESES